MPLKGRTKIELFKNGKPVLTHEESNLVTNMVSDMLKCRFGPSYLTGNCRLNKTTLYKGLVLFKDALTESATEYGVPGNIDITGRGYESNALSADLDTGTFNTNLSTQSNSRISYVWDFDEEHGNGRISCVSLVPQNLAKFLKNTRDNFTVPSDSDSFCNEPVFECLSADTLPVYFDVTNQCVYCVSMSATGNLSISKYFINQLRPLVGSDGMTDFRPGYLGNRAMRLLDACYFTAVGVVDLSQIITANGTYSFMMCDKDGYLYVGATNTQTLATNATLHIAKVNVKTATAEDYSLVNQSNETLKFAQTGLSGTRYYRPCSREFTVFGGYFWFRTSSNRIIAINIANNSTYHICTDRDGATPITVSDHYDANLGSGGFMTTTESVNELGSNGDMYSVRFVPLGPKTLGVLHNPREAKPNISCIDTDTFVSQGYITTASLCGSYSSRTHLPGWQVTASSGLNLQLASVPCGAYSITSAVFGGYFWQPMLWGLQTINNLDSPVTKTADLTMRVTYVLEEEEPVGMTTPELAASASENAGGGE